MIILTKKFRFSAAHSYNNPRWTEQENAEAFGDDHRVHGHNYELEISVSGDVDPETGFLSDLGAIKQVVQTRAIDLLDHARIEADIPWFKERQPSSENLVVFIWGELDGHLPAGTQLVRVRLYETPTIFAEYDGKR